MARFGSLGTQYFDDDGKPLINGFITFTESGDPNTDKDTFADPNLTPEFVNENPVPLTAAGRQPDIHFSGTARAVLFTADMVQIEVRDPVGGETLEGSFSAWDTLTIYNIPDIVVGSDNRFYISITDGNQSNNPVTDAVNWTEISFIRSWNLNETYALDKVVQASDGLLYVSLVDNNLNNDPATDDGTNWGPSSLPNLDDFTQSVISSYALENF